MARRSLTEREKRRTALTERHFERRADLKTLISAPGTDPDVRAAAAGDTTSEAVKTARRRAG